MKYLKGIAKVTLITALVAAALVIPLAIQRCDDTYRSATLFAMDTTLDITIQGRGKSQVRDDVEAAFELAKNIESYTSRFESESDVSKINACAGLEPVKVHKETLEIVERCLEFSRLTDGAYDITVAPAIKLWGFYERHYRIPGEEEIAVAIQLVDYRKILVDPDNVTIMLAEPGMEIDLGGAAKGYAVGAMDRLLRERGVRSGLVNFGGAVAAIGNRSDGKPWVIGIRSPRGEGNDLAGELDIEDACVSSSGDYERFFTRQGKRYHHILDPATGRNPAGTMSVTVVGKDAMDTDILSTSMMVLGKQEGFELLKDFPGYEAVIIESSGKVELSVNIKKKYRIRIEENIK